MCECRISTVAKMRGLEYQRLMKKKRGRPKAATPDDRPTSCKVCSNCFASIYRGSNHSASACKHSRRSKVYNVENLVQSPVTLERVASRVIKQSSETPLSTLGPKEKQLVVNTQPRKELFTAGDLCGIQQDLQLSDTRVRTLAQDIRIAIAPGLRAKLVENSHRFDEYFEAYKIIYRRENKETKVSENFEQSTVMCNNVPDFIDVILRERLLEDKDSVLIRIGIDGGGGFLKICLSIFDINDPFSNVQSGVSNKFKESGVKKIFLIAIVPNMPENYVNVKKLWINLCLQTLDKRFTVAKDLKLCNILLGMMSHISMHPCCWCDIKKGNLHKNDKQRTIPHLMSLLRDFWESRAEKKDAKDFGTVIHPTILCDNADNDIPVIALLPPPGPHLLIGPVNTMYGGMKNGFLRATSRKLTITAEVLQEMTVELS